MTPVRVSATLFPVLSPAIATKTTRVKARRLALRETETHEFVAMASATTSSPLLASGPKQHHTGEVTKRPDGLRNGKAKRQGGL
ncbi:hypothetical protein C8034_v009322 [Colletotrichum sidae]|uniref:Uncharacterized protein n=1 Tax=Colletotrichum sidae TaxID=1347389 RepID=A0A4V3I4U6_9PEZI|nr:hypothetical protein C8034_v009322 [Colletotrichum sidae]